MNWRAGALHAVDGALRRLICGAVLIGTIACKPAHAATVTWQNEAFVCLSACTDGDTFDAAMITFPGFFANTLAGIAGSGFIRNESGIASSFYMSLVIDGAGARDIFALGLAPSEKIDLNEIFVPAHWPLVPEPGFVSTIYWGDNAVNVQSFSGVISGIVLHRAVPVNSRAFDLGPSTTFLFDALPPPDAIPEPQAGAALLAIAFAVIWQMRRRHTAARRSAGW